MVKVTDFTQIKDALENDKKLYLKDDELLCYFSKDFWMLCPFIMVARSLDKEEIYVEE